MAVLVLVVQKEQLVGAKMFLLTERSEVIYVDEEETVKKGTHQRSRPMSKWRVMIYI